MHLTLIWEEKISASAIVFLICVLVCCLVGYEFNGGKHFPPFSCAFQLYT